MLIFTLLTTIERFLFCFRNNFRMEAEQVFFVAVVGKSGEKTENRKSLKDKRHDLQD